MRSESIGPGDERRLGAERQRHRVERRVQRAHRRRLGDLAELGRGGVLALGQAVDPVVEQQDLEVDVAAQRVDQVVAADRQRVAVTGDHPHRQVRPRRGEAGRDRRRPAVDRVHPVGVHVVREARRAADARDEDDVLPRQPELGHERLHRGEDRVVAAARAPADLLVGLEVLGRLRPAGLRHQVERPVARRCGGTVGRLVRVVSVVGHRRSSLHSDDHVRQLLGLERQAADLVVADGVDEVLRAQQHRELPRAVAEVHLRHQHLVVAAQHVAEVGRERVEVAQVGLGDLDAVSAHEPAGRADRAVRGAPAEHQHPRLAARGPRPPAAGWSRRRRRPWPAGCGP